MYAKEPDLVILLGARTMVSFVSILAIAIGNWRQEDVIEQEAIARAEANWLTRASSSRLAATTAMHSAKLAAAAAAATATAASTTHRPTASASASASPSVSAVCCCSIEDGTDDEDQPVWHLTCGDGVPQDPKNSNHLTKSPSSNPSSPSSPSTAALWCIGIYQRIQGFLARQLSLIQFWPALVLTGWLLLGFASILSYRNYFGFDMNVFAVLMLLHCLFMAGTQFAQHHPHHNMIMDHHHHYHHYWKPHALQHMYLTAFGFVVLGVWLTAARSGSTRTWAPGFFGAVALALSLPASWYARRAGGDAYAAAAAAAAAAASSSSSSSYSHHYVLSPRVIVFHLGGLLWATGWFWFLIGMNAVPGMPDAWYLPIYFGSRAAVAYTGALLIVLTLYSVGYVFDEAERCTPVLVLDLDAAEEEEDWTAWPSSSTTPAHAQRVAHRMHTSTKRYCSKFCCSSSSSITPGFGGCGYKFGAVWHIKFVMTAEWMYMGSAVFRPNMDLMQESHVVGAYVTFLFFALEGMALGIFYEHALRSKSADNVRRWARIAHGLCIGFMLALCSLGGLTRIILTVLATACIMAGQYLLHQDRKRGQHWVETHGAKQNASPKAFSMGSPLLTLGMHLLAWAVSIRT